MENKEIIIGRNPVFEYIRELNNGCGASVHILQSAHGKIIEDIIALCKKKKIDIKYESKDFFSRYASSSTHQGVILFLPKTIHKEDTKSFLTGIAKNNGVIVLLDQITDPHNLGSIIRSAEALGCNAIILPKDNSATINETVIKTSAGATAHIKIITITNVSQFLDEIKDSGFWIIGTSGNANTDIALIKNVKPACIIIGNEGKGMRRLTEEKCDYIVSIPLKGKISSLNASVAAGIIIYKIINE